MGIRDKPIAPASSWQNGFAERLIGSIRRECLDHFIVLGEAHLRRILRAYAGYYNLIRSVIGQRCAGLAPSSADRIHKFPRDPWRASSSLCAGLGFWYTQGAGHPHPRGPRSRCGTAPQERLGPGRGKPGPLASLDYSTSSRNRPVPPANFAPAGCQAESDVLIMLPI